MEIRVNEFVHLGIDLTEDQFKRLPVKEQYILIKEAEYLARQRERNPLPFFVPNGVQEKFIKMIGNSPLTKKKIFINSSSNATGKCLPLDAPILMADGTFKRLEDVVVGDWVIAHDYDGDGIGRPARVLETSRSGIKEVFKFTFSDGGFVMGSDEHSFPVRYKSGRGSAVKKRSISEFRKRKTSYVGGRVKFRQPKTIDFQFGQSLPIHPYLLGYLIGDGTLSPNTRGVSFTTQDSRVVDRMAKLLSEAGYRIVGSTKRNNRATTYRVQRIAPWARLYGLRSCRYCHEKKRRHAGLGYCVNCLTRLRRESPRMLAQEAKFYKGDFPIESALERLGLRTYSPERFVPQLYKISSIEERRELLSGLIDSDGAYKEFSTRSPKLADDFCFLVKSLGGRAINHVRGQVTNYSHGKTVWSNRVYWAFGGLLPLSCTYKQKSPKKPPEYENRFTRKIESMGMMECGDIFIDHPKHAFLSYDFISTGNSAVACNMLGNLIWGRQTNWFNYPLFNNPWPWPKKIWYMSEHDAFQNKLIGEMKKWFPKKRYTFIKAGRKFDSQMESDTGWVLSAKTFDQSPKQFEADDVSIILFDEPPPRELRQAAVSRLRLGGIEIFVMTPLGHSAWIFDDIIDNEEQQPHTEVLYADMEDACKQHGVRGQLDHEQIMFLASQMDEDEKEARLHGKPKHLSGKIYKMLHPDVHRHDRLPQEFNQDQNVIYCGMDIHDRRPPAIVWMAADMNGKFWVIDEYPNDPAQPYHTIKSTSLTYKDFADIIKRKEAENHWDSNRVVRVIDPNYGVRNVQAYGKTIAEIFGEEGLYFITNIRDDVAAGHAAVKDLLALDLDGTPSLKIARTCYNTFFQLYRYGVKEFSARKAETDGLSERVAKKYADFSDCCRYLAMLIETPTIEKIAEKKPILPREYDQSNQNSPSTEGWQNPFSQEPRVTVTRILR